MKEQNFKQTEIGKIPVDWEILKLQEICNFQNGVGHEQFESENGKYIVVNSKFISTESKVKRFCDKDLVPLLKNDITIVMSDIPNGKALAKCYIIEKDNCYSLNQRIGRIVITEMSAKFYFYYLNRNKYFISFDSGSGQTNLRKQEVLDCPIILPPLAEQEKIAEVLSDTDLWIESTEALLAKKRQIKKGAMQKLLSPKEDWEVRKLGEVVKITRGASPRPIDNPIWFQEDSKIGWVRISDVSKSNKFLFRTTQKLSPEGISKSRFVHSNSLIMSICATLGKPIITTFDVCIHDGFVVFSDLKIEKEYLYNYLKFIEDDWSKTGQTGSQMNLNTTIINGTEINFPEKAKQQEIAEILSSMDLEIESLENRLQKARQLKQGMMQDLLTGKVRLIEN